MSARLYSRLSVAITVALLCIALVGIAPADTSNKDSIAIGSDAPNFEMPDISGKLVRLDDYRGQVVVLNFWAFWCDTWKAELPHLRELSKSQDTLGFQLVAVSVDGTRLSEFQDHNGGPVPFPVLMDVGSKTSASYHVAHVPTVVILDKRGKVRYTACGYPGNQAVLTQIRKLE